VTKTGLFAAAMSASGPSDNISEYGSLRESGESAQYLFENSQFRIGGTLWDKQDLYIKNSPIFFANQVSTPLLLMNNMNDRAVSWTQGLEWYMALRRLNKKSVDAAV